MPLAKPGAYLIRNIVNGKCYVGISQNVAKRLKEHARGTSKASLLRKAIKKYGASAFEATPLLYSTCGTAWLPIVEAELIILWNCLEHGYNIQAASGAVGPYGEKFRAAARQGKANPVTKAKLRAAALAFAQTDAGKLHYKANVALMHSPAVRVRADKKMRETVRSAEARAAASARIRKSQAQPGFWERHQAKRNATLSLASLRAEWSAIHKQRRIAGTARDAWITDETCSRRIGENETIPEGWRSGRPLRKKSIG